MAGLPTLAVAMGLHLLPAAGVDVAAGQAVVSPEVMGLHLLPAVGAGHAGKRR